MLLTLSGSCWLSSVPENYLPVRDFSFLEHIIGHNECQAASCEVYKMSGAALGGFVICKDERKFGKNAICNHIISCELDGD